MPQIHDSDDLHVSFYASFLSPFTTFNHQKRTNKKLLTRIEPTIIIVAMSIKSTTEEFRDAEGGACIRDMPTLKSCEFFEAIKFVEGLNRAERLYGQAAMPTIPLQRLCDDVVLRFLEATKVDISDSDIKIAAMKLL